MPTYDAIVLGTGGIGSAALLHLAKRGCKVLGIDRFACPHDRGSSHGQTRIIRQAYFEHPDYVPLLLETYRLWDELAQEVGRQLYHEVGVLQIGPPEGEVVAGVFRAAEIHHLQVERLTPEDIEQRWPALSVPQEMIGAFEPRAGYLHVEPCVAAHLEAAEQAGAELLGSCEVQSWQPGPPVTLQTTSGQLTANRLIVTAGSWAGPLLADLNLKLEVLRKSFFWHAPQAGHDAAHESLPCFLYDLPSGVFYGMPRRDERGVKIAEHSGGQVVSDPLTVDREVDSADQARTRAFIAQHLPQLSPQHGDHAVCLYTMSPDQHFVLDRHPHHQHVAFAAGMSGHGFKFAPVLGKALTELVLDGATELPIEFLGLR